MTDEPVRLNKYLAFMLGTSRREADDLIREGKVTVDDSVADLGTRVTKASHVTVDGNQLIEAPAYRYIAFNKPVGYVCSRRAQGDTPTIYSLLPVDMTNLKPVGRLDKDSSGLLLLTNDGDFAHAMTHPKFAKIKIYRVTLTTPLAPLHQQMIADYGVEIGDGVSKFALERIDDDRKDWIITMSEGRNRQIRRTFAALGYDVSALHRTNFGNYSLGDIKPGKFEPIVIH